MPPYNSEHSRKNYSRRPDKPSPRTGNTQFNETVYSITSYCAEKRSKKDPEANTYDSSPRPPIINHDHHNRCSGHDIKRLGISRFGRPQSKSAECAGGSQRSYRAFRRTPLNLPDALLGGGFRAQDLRPDSRRARICRESEDTDRKVSREPRR